MKKLFLKSLILLMIMMSTLIACKKPNNEADGITCRLLTDATGVDDKSFNASAWEGIVQFYGDTWDNQSKRGKLYDVVIAPTEDMYVSNLMLATDEGYDLIAATGFTWTEPIAQVAGKNPEQNYMIVDVNEINLPNVMEAAYAEHEGSYLVGAAAALKALEDGITNPRFGFIGGIPNAVITKFEVGYIQGILSIIPNAEIIDYYVNSWGDPGMAKIQAKNWYDSGCYAIFSAAGGSGNGTISQAKEYRQAGKNVWAIGVDSDQYEEGLYNENESAVLTSMLKKVEKSLIYALDLIAQDKFQGHAIVFDLAADGVGYSQANSALTSNIIEKLEKIKQEIVDGNIVIKTTHAESKLLPGFPQNLRAVDD